MTTVDPKCFLHRWRPICFYWQWIQAWITGFLRSLPFSIFKFVSLTEVAVLQGAGGLLQKLCYYFRNTLLIICNFFLHSLHEFSQIWLFTILLRYPERKVYDGVLYIRRSRVSASFLMLLASTCLRLFFGLELSIYLLFFHFHHIM